MRLHADSGLWTAGPAAPPPPGVAVLEVDGAVFEWAVDAPARPPRVAFTDVAAADWLWRVVGPAAHVALLDAIQYAVAEEGRAVDVEAEFDASALAPLRRVALGHWLRRWWPASARDGIVALDPVVLDAELALLTAALQDYLSEDALDVEIAGLLGPHRAELATRATGDPRVAQLVTACADLADESGVAMPSRPLATVAKESAQADYALAAGAGGGARGTEPIASGVSSVHWAAVPHGCFDAADRTVDWTVEVAGHATIAAIRVAATGSVAGIEVRLRSGTLGAFGVLDGDGRATIEILDHDRRPVTEAAAWNHEWPQTVVTVGADVQDSDDAAVLRERLRDVARGRLAAPGPDAYLAEILAAESDY